MAKDPAILFYTADFLIGTDHFTESEVGQYMRILCYQHQHGHLSQDFISRKFINGLFPEVLKKLKKDESGNMFQHRMEDEINKRNNYCDSRRKSINNRWHKNDKPLKNKQVKRDTYVDTCVLRMVNENEDENINAIENKIPPSIEGIKRYCLERKNSVDPEKWFSHYESNGWMVGKTKMKNWRAAIRTWEKNSFDNKLEKKYFPGTTHEVPVLAL